MNQLIDNPLTASEYDALVKQLEEKYCAQTAKDMLPWALIVKHGYHRIAITLVDLAIVNNDLETIDLAVGHLNAMRDSSDETNRRNYKEYYPGLRIVRNDALPLATIQSLLQHFKADWVLTAAVERNDLIFFNAVLPHCDPLSENSEAYQKAWLLERTHFQKILEPLSNPICALAGLLKTDLTAGIALHQAILDGRVCGRECPEYAQLFTTGVCYPTAEIAGMLPMGNLNTWGFVFKTWQAAFKDHHIPKFAPQPVDNSILSESQMRILAFHWAALEGNVEHIVDLAPLVGVEDSTWALIAALDRGDTTTAQTLLAFSHPHRHNSLALRIALANHHWELADRMNGAAAQYCGRLLKKSIEENNAIAVEKLLRFAKPDIDEIQSEKKGTIFEEIHRVPAHNNFHALVAAIKAEQIKWVNALIPLCNPKTLASLPLRWACCTEFEQAIDSLFDCSDPIAALKSLQDKHPNNPKVWGTLQQRIDNQRQRAVLSQAANGAQRSALRKI